MARIVILGAGLTGLSAAYHLEKKGFTDYALFEKETTVGGLCRSVQQDGFTFDFTGHLLHINDPYFQQFIESLVGLDFFNAITRRSFIYTHGVYTKYPFQMNLYGLPIPIIAECIEGFVKRKKGKRTPLMFKEWVAQSFGSGFGKYFFHPYQQKIFACNLNTLTADWTGRFVPSTSLNAIIEGALTDQQETVGYNAHFYYPKQGGIVSWVEKIGHALEKQIYTDYTVTRIDAKRKVVFFANGHEESYEHLITTLPLDTFLSLLHEPAHTSLQRARHHLRCNAVINFNLGIARENISDKHWIYFPETHFPFYRLGFAHNFSSSMAPAGCSSLYGEFSHIHKSKRWINATLKKSIAATKKLLAIADHEIITEKVMHIPHAYVIYDQWRKRNLPRLLAQLSALHIESVGRYGAWKYSSMQEGVLDGKKIAEQLVIKPATKSWIAPEVGPTPQPQSRVSSP